MGTALGEPWGRGRSQCSTESCGTVIKQTWEQGRCKQLVLRILDKGTASAKEVRMWAGLGAEWVLWPEETVCEQSPRAGKVQK